MLFSVVRALFLFLYSSVKSFTFNGHYTEKEEITGWSSHVKLLPVQCKENNVCFPF